MAFLSNKLNIVNIVCVLLLVALIVVLIVCLVKNNEQFGEENSKENNEENCDVLMYHRVGCPYSDKMLKLLKNNNMKIGNMKVCIRNINHPEANEHGAQGTPTLVNKHKSHLKSVGFNPDLNKVENDLNGNKSSNDGPDEHNNNKSNILLIGTMGCPFCIKAKNLMDEMQLDYEFVESNSPKGKDNMTKHDMNGVPLIIHLTMNIVIKGFDAEKIKQLKN